MRRLARGLGFSVLGLVTLVAAAAGYVRFALPRVGAAPAIAASHDPAVLARGEYLAQNVAVCVDCHSSRDFSKFSGPLQQGTLWRGGERFGHAIGLPGELTAPNITPAALSGWSDGDLARAITEGVTPDGRALFPFMGYPRYAQLCKPDLTALVSYLRSLPPVEGRTAPSELDFPVNLIARTLPKAAAISDTCPDRNDSVAYGRYLTTAAGCADCHTRSEGGTPVAGQDFAGGMRLPLPSGYVALSANITPDAQSGIGRWSKEAFVGRFAAFRNPVTAVPVPGRAANTPMPWQLFAGMSDEDLGAIYDYLRTVPAVRTTVAEPVAAR
ncbi:MAG: c-type cytochrome [Polyangiales bacterium]